MLMSVMLLSMISNVGNTYQGVTDEENLIQSLLQNSSMSARPVKNASRPVKVDVFMEIIRIDAVSEKGQSMRTIFHILLEWKNELLTWDPSDFKNIDEVIIPKSKIWTPPLYLFNEAVKTNSESTDDNDHMVSLTRDGNCSISYTKFYKTTCEINVKFFPFDEHFCDLLLGSWGMDNRLLELRATNHDVISDEYKPNGEWELVYAKAKEEKIRYNVQKRNHSIIKIAMKIERKYVFFIMNLIIPCALIACMIFLVFVLPPKSGERIALAITVMLSMAIFQELSSEKLPTSSDNYPLLGIYYLTAISEIGMALIMNCFIINLYYRHYEMPPWIRRLLMERLAKLARVDVPVFRTQAYIEKMKMKEQPTHELSTFNDAPRRASANDSNHVLEDIEDDGSMANGRSDITYFPSDSVSRDEQSKIQRHNSTHMKKGRVIFRGGSGRKNSGHKTEQQISEENIKLLREDWKLAARVMDRVMLGTAVTVGVVSFFAIFSQAPRSRAMFVL